ncbi:MAG: hypothetical protein ACOX1F_07695 [Erysipelotrichaceae bacterium]|jgi:hypothetical protein
MEDFKKIAKSVVNAIIKTTVAVVEITAVSVEKAIEVAREIKQNRVQELFIAKEGYKRYVINKTKKSKYGIYEIFNSQEKSEYIIDGKLTEKNCDISFVAGGQIVADVYENKSKRKKGLFHDSVSYEFILKVNENHYGLINVGFDEGELKFYLDTNKWEVSAKATDYRIEISDELDQVVCLIDLKPKVREMITVDVKENHNQLLALMYCFVIMAINKYMKNN